MTAAKTISSSVEQLKSQSDHVLIEPPPLEPMHLAWDDGYGPFLQEKITPNSVLSAATAPTQTPWTDQDQCTPSKNADSAHSKMTATQDELLSKI
jgi:hypothetical protein